MNHYQFLLVSTNMYTFQVSPLHCQRLLRALKVCISRVKKNREVHFLTSIPIRIPAISERQNIAVSNTPIGQSLGHEMNLRTK